MSFPHLSGPSPTCFLATTNNLNMARSSYPSLSCVAWIAYWKNAKPEYPWKAPGRTRNAPYQSLPCVPVGTAGRSRCRGAAHLSHDQGNPDHHMLRIIERAAGRVVSPRLPAHSDLALTMRYLRAASGPGVRAEVASFWAA
jgi:hypothetical protein